MEFSCSPPNYQALYNQLYQERQDLRKVIRANIEDSIKIRDNNIDDVDYSFWNGKTVALEEILKKV